jgi:hypothetical protein
MLTPAEKQATFSFHSTEGLRAAGEAHKKIPETQPALSREICRAHQSLL